MQAARRSSGVFREVRRTWRRDFENFAPLRWPDGCFADEYHWKDGIA